MNVFITGVSGFAGSSLVRYFHNKPGFNIYGHSRNVNQTRKKYESIAIKWVETYSAQVFTNLKIDCVIHLAGIAHDLSNRYVEADYYNVNCENTKIVYDYFLNSTASKFIFLSSVKAVVDHTDFPVEENQPPNPQTPYGKSKRKAEEYIMSKEEGVGKQYYILRPCMIHGPENKGNLNLLYRYVKSGLPYPLAKFSNQRSFLSADNFNFFIERLLTLPISSGVFHVSDNGTLSTTEVVKLIAEGSHRSARLWRLPVGLMRFIFSLYSVKMLEKLTGNMIVPNTKLVSLTGNPPVDIQEGIKRTIRSFDV